MTCMFAPTPIKWTEKSDVVDAETQFEIATRYYLGRGVRQDFGTAMIGFRMAVALTHAFKHDDMGFCIPHDSDDCATPESMTRAIQKHRRAAELGNADAQHRLGCCHLLAGNEDRSACEALRWFRMAARRGHIPAQYNLGVGELHESFMWVIGSHKKYAATTRRAAKWFRLAAMGGVDGGE